MKGLLVKDFKLMKGQRNFFFIIIVAAIGPAVFFDNLSFMMGFLPFVLSLFTLSTISYDEFDNGNAFLFTLPISRTGYAVEKYCFALLLGGGAWLFASLTAIVIGTVKETASVSEIVMTALLILPALLVVQAVMIPFQLKFGGEKGRLALIGAFGLLFVIGAAAIRVVKKSGIELSNLAANLPSVRMGVLDAVLFLAAVIIMLLSMKISISIMNKKEF